MQIFYVMRRGHLPCDEGRELPPVTDDMYVIPEHLKPLGAPKQHTQLIPLEEVACTLRPAKTAEWQQVQQTVLLTTCHATYSTVWQHGSCWSSLASARKVQEGGIHKNAPWG